MKNLSLRLEKIASFVDDGAYLADVGSDHGALPIYLLNSGKISFAEAIENKKGPFERLKKAVGENVLNQDKILLSFSSGISDLDPKINEVVIAGMGGRLISSILLEHKEKLDNVDTLIIDAHSEWDVVLSTLATLSYKVVEEAFFFESDIFYSVWKAKKSDEKVAYSKAEMLFGPLESHRKGEDWQRFALIKENQWKEILKKDISEEKRREIEDKLKLLTEVRG